MSLGDACTSEMQPQALPLLVTVHVCTPHLAMRGGWEPYPQLETCPQMSRARHKSLVAPELLHSHSFLSCCGVLTEREAGGGPCVMCPECCALAVGLCQRLELRMSLTHGRVAVGQTEAALPQGHITTTPPLSTRQLGGQTSDGSHVFWKPGEALGSVWN